MGREEQKALAQKFVEAQGKWDTSAIEATLASDAKHDLLPASLGVGQKDNAGKLEITKKMGAALGDKPVNVSAVSDCSMRERARLIIVLLDRSRSCRPSRTSTSARRRSSSRRSTSLARCSRSWS